MPFLAGGFVALYGFFTPSTPGMVILLLLLAGGFFRSLQFTGINTLTMSDVPQTRMSQASSFSSIGQQLSLSVGVGVGAMVLHFTIALPWRGAGQRGGLPAGLLPGRADRDRVAAVLSAAGRGCRRRSDRPSRRARPEPRSAE